MSRSGMRIDPREQRSKRLPQRTIQISGNWSILTSLTHT